MSQIELEKKTVASREDVMEKLKEADKQHAREILNDMLFRHLQKLSPHTQEAS
jgi:hypothetical protein